MAEKLKFEPKPKAITIDKGWEKPVYKPAKKTGGNSNGSKKGK